MCIDPHNGSRGGLGDKLFRGNFKDARARVGGVRPFGDPLQTERGIDAVQIRESREQTKGMLANVDTHGAALEFENGRRQRCQKSGGRAFASQAEERAVDHGESKGVSGHGEACQASSSIRAGDQKLRSRGGEWAQAWRRAIHGQLFFVEGVLGRMGSLPVTSKAFVGYRVFKYIPAGCPRRTINGDFAHCNVDNLQTRFGK